MEKPKSRPETDAQKIDEFVRRQAIAAADDYERRLNADASLDHIRLTPEMKEDMMRRIAELEGRAGAGTGADTESAGAGRSADAASAGAGGFTGAAGTGESAGAVGASVDISVDAPGVPTAFADRVIVGAGDAASEHAATAEDALRLLSEEDRRALEVGRETLAKRGRRRRWRVVGIAAAAVVVMLGIGMTSTANRVRLANLWKSLLGEEAWFQLNNDDVKNTNDWSIQEACADILEHTGIRAVQFMYRPDSMVFESYVVDEHISRAYMRYIYSGLLFNVRMVKKGTNTAMGLTFEGEVQDTFSVHTGYGEIVIQEIKSQNGETTYGAELLYDNCQYTVMGSMEKEEFVKLIENINLF